MTGAATVLLNDINDHGTIAGLYVDTANHPHGMIVKAGTPFMLDFPGATDTWIQGINNLDQVVGFYLAPGGSEYRGFLGSPGAAVPEPAVATTISSLVLVATGLLLRMRRIAGLAGVRTFL